MKHFHFYDEIYRVNWVFYIGKAVEFQKFIKKQYGIELSISKHAIGGRCYDVEDFGIIIHLPIFKKTPAYYGVLVHEILHGVLFIFDTRQILFTAEYSEQITYYIESIVRLFFETYNKK